MFIAYKEASARLKKVGVLEDVAYFASGELEFKITKDAKLSELVKGKWKLRKSILRGSRPCYCVGNARYSASLLVLFAFSEDQEEDVVVRTLDGDRHNCNLSNLSWYEGDFLEGDLLVRAVSKVFGLSALAWVEGYSGYVVSRCGRCFSGYRGSGRYTFSELTTLKNGHGRQKLLADSGEVKSIVWARLICRAFHGEAPEGKPWVLHWDDDRTNNKAENLRWGDAKENRKDCERNGHAAKGEDISTLKETQVIEIRAMYAQGGWTFAELGRRFSVTYVTIRNIVKRRTWRHIK